MPSELDDLMAFLSQSGGRPRDVNGKRGVEWSPDFDRVDALPTRYVPHQLPGGMWPGCGLKAPDLTDKFRKPGGVWRLSEDQSRALYECGLARGGMVFLPPGYGKTLVAYLLCQELECRRAMIFTMAGVVGQFINEELPRYLDHFRIDTTRVSVHSHESLSSPDGTDLLEREQPDLIVIDEIHKFKDPDAVRTERMSRYKRKRPRTLFVGLSASILQTSVRNFFHLMLWCLNERAPVPAEREVALAWAQAMDPGKVGQPPLSPGVLQRWIGPRENLRQAYRRRLMDTVGVIGARGEGVNVPLNIHRWDVPVPPVVQSALAQLENTWTRPDGEEFQDALAIHRVKKQLSAGMYTRWLWGETGPDMEWIDARKDWHHVVRDRLDKFTAPQMDSPFFLAAAAERGWLKYHGLLNANQEHMPRWTLKTGEPLPEWDAWRRVKHREPPPTEVVWVSDFVVKAAAAWLHKYPGIVWSKHTAVGQAIAAEAGVPFYGPGEQASAAIMAHNDRCNATGPTGAVASIGAHGTGKNLQGWNKMLFVECPQSATAFEQTIGRMHRQGQNAPAVDVWVMLHTEAFEESFAAALRQAEFVEDTIQTVGRHKLLSANYSFQKHSVMHFDTAILDRLWRDGEND